MKLVPYGAGWTDVYLDIGKDNLYFILSSVLGDTFTDLLGIHHNEKVDTVLFHVSTFVF